MRESGDTVHVNVLSVQAEQIREVVTPRRVTINKEKGTFGFFLFQDDKGKLITVNSHEICFYAKLNFNMKLFPIVILRH